MTVPFDAVAKAPDIEIRLAPNMTDVLAIVSRAVFEKDARDLQEQAPRVGDVWPLDRYNSSHKTSIASKAGGRIFLVTVRPTKSCWFLGVDRRAVVHRHVLGVEEEKRSRDHEHHVAAKDDRVRVGQRNVAGQRHARDEPADAARHDASGRRADPRGRIGKAPPPSAFVAAPPPSKPRIIGGKYEIVKQLGVGGMGVVYEAVHTGTGRRVAVKEILGDELRERENVIERFQREARATGAIETSTSRPCSTRAPTPPRTIRIW